MTEEDLEAFAKNLRFTEKALRVKVKIPHDEVDRIVVNRLIQIRNNSASRNESNEHIDKVIRMFLFENEFKKYVIDKKKIKY